MLQQLQQPLGMRKKDKKHYNDNHNRDNKNNPDKKN